MFSTPGKKRGLLDSAVHKVKNLIRSGRTTPEPTSNPKHDVQHSSHPLCEPPQLQASNKTSCDISRSPLLSAKESSLEGPVLPSHHRSACIAISAVAAIQIDQTSALLLNRASEALKVVREGAGVFPPFQAAIDEVILCLEGIQIDSKHSGEYDRMLSSLGALGDTLDFHMQKSNPLRMSGCIAKMTKSINEQTHIIKGRQDLSTKRKVAKAEQDDEDIMNAYRRIEAAFQQLQTEAILSVWGIVDEQAANNLLDKLSPSKLASHNSTLADDIGRRVCTESTREQVLSNLDSWSNDFAAPKIYWMNGMAGTGKTTIAYTFAQSLKARGALGASFFCTRTSGECREVARIIPTIAYQLARSFAPFKSAMADILSKDSDIGSQTMADQIKTLIIEPLLQVKDVMPRGLVVLIDALDECSSPKAVGQMLDALFAAAPGLPLKFFVASRPEPSIHPRVHGQPDLMRSICVLHDIEKSLVQADIRLYLQEELRFMAATETQLHQLAELSGNLFIYAATAIRYVRAEGTIVDHNERLETILSASSKGGQYTEINELYTTVLSAALENKMLEQSEQHQMKLVLWTVVCACEPLDVETIAALVGIGARKASILLQSLFSVVHVSKASGMVTTLHASFPDFLLDESRSNRLHCNEARHHEVLAKECFTIMERQLRFNICELESSFVPDSEVQDLASRISRAISPTLSYVAHHWGSHAARSPVGEYLQTRLQEFLSSRLLLWMEVLSLKRTLGVGISMLSELKSWASSITTSSDLIRSLDDSWLFLARFAANPISQSTPHIYISALPFCHHSSFVYQQYWPRTRQLVSVQGSVVEQSWTLLVANWAMHSEPFALSFYPDGSRLAIGFEDGTIHILNPHSGALVLGPLSGHTGLVRSISFSPDGSMFASGSYDTTVIVWDAYTGTRIVGPIKAHDDKTLSVCFSSDGHHILSGSMDGTTRIWDSRTGSLVPNSTTRHPHPVLHAAFFPGDRYIACGLDSDECPMVILSISTGEQVPGWHMQQGSSMRVISFSPDGRYAVTGHVSGDVRVWSVQDGTIIHELAKVHSNWIRSIAFSPRGSKLLIASADGTVYAWDPQSGYGEPWLFGRHREDTRCVVFSPDGTRAISCSSDRTVKLWNALHSTSSDRQPWKAPTNGVWSVAVSPDGSRIAAASGDHTIYMFSVQNGSATLEPLVAHTAAIYSVAFSDDGRYIASGGADQAICLWDGRSGKPLSGLLRLHTGAIRSISFSPHGRWVASASDDGAIRMWDVGDGTLTASDLVAKHESAVHSVSFSSDGKRVVSGCADRSIRVWDPQTLSLLLGPFGSQAHTDMILSATFSPNGTLIASGSLDCTICVFDSYTGHLVLGPLNAHTGWIWSVVFSPDGTHIVSGSSDGTIGVWSVKDGAAVCEPMQGHQSYVSSVAYSPDGAYIISGSFDSTIRVWTAPGILTASRVLQSVSSSSGQMTPHNAITGVLKISEDGWLRNDKSQLVFWVPPEMADIVPIFPSYLRIWSQGSLRVSYGKPLSLGNKWDQCYADEE
ncbi:unnamed protein product [Rhizoctonia solani]|uniref:NACHT domain-containing protein n=1 Tax=Rhizoctonia solani TaxID=456999 RepID=A0A8H3CJJ3_9AGAM|nr:unnamed protein product [Rhizoctonia solani]